MDGVGDRGLSEVTGVAVLVAAAVLVVASVGLGVLFAGGGDESRTDASFRYQYTAETSFLIITHTGGDRLAAADLYIEGPAGNRSWATLAGFNGSQEVGQGARVLVSKSGPYGAQVGASDTFRVVYTPENGTRTVLKTCAAQCSG